MGKRILAVTAAAACGLGLSMQAAAHDEPVVGVLAGAGIGAAIGNAPGAVVGAIIGAIGGASMAHESDHGHRHARYMQVGSTRYYYRQPVAHYEDPAPYGYRRTVTYVENGTPMYCNPQAGYSRPVIVERPAYTKVTTTKTSMKKVCRYEPVKKTVTAYVPASKRVG